MFMCLDRDAGQSYSLAPTDQQPTASAMLSPPRSVLITGASSGLGAALARRYAAPGIHLALTGRDPARLAEVAVACRAAGARVDAAMLDVTDRPALAAWIAQIDGAHSLDLVIANAGIGGQVGGIEDETDARAVFAVNLDGVLNTIYPLMPRMVARGTGQIAIMSSIAGYHGLPVAPGYSASKAAVRALGEAWRGMLASSGVHVSVICPGFVATPMTAGARFPTPFMISAERAAEIIQRGLAQDRPRITFPVPMAFLAWLMAALPECVVARLVPRG
jgi:short-subunit dehydrogenase